MCEKIKVWQEKNFVVESAAIKVYSTSDCLAVGLRMGSQSESFQLQRHCKVEFSGSADMDFEQVTSTDANYKE